jgi:hypothetical protein
MIIHFMFYLKFLEFNCYLIVVIIYKYCWYIFILCGIVFNFYIC